MNLKKCGTCPLTIQKTCSFIFQKTPSDLLYFVLKFIEPVILYYYSLTPLYNLGGDTYIDVLTMRCNNDWKEYSLLYKAQAFFTLFLTMSESKFPTIKIIFLHKSHASLAL